MLHTTVADVDDVAAPLHGDLTSDLVAGGSISIRNMDPANTVFVGGEDVTAATGYPVDPDGEFATDLAQDEVLHAVTGAGLTATCRVFLQGA